MRSRKRPAKQPDFELELRFEQEVRRLPAGARPALLAWLRGWRRPRREFWEVTPTGEWRRL